MGRIIINRNAVLDLLSELINMHLIPRTRLSRWYEFSRVFNVTVGSVESLGCLSNCRSHSLVPTGLRLTGEFQSVGSSWGELDCPFEPESRLWFGFTVMHVLWCKLCFLDFPADIKESSFFIVRQHHTVMNRSKDPHCWHCPWPRDCRLSLPDWDIYPLTRAIICCGSLTCEPGLNHPVLLTFFSDLPGSLRGPAETDSARPQCPLSKAHLLVLFFGR